MRFTALFFLLCIGNGISAQSQPCGTSALLQQTLLQYPEAKEQLNQLNKIISEAHTSSHTGNRDAVVTIPVVFHIIHSGETPGNGKNISAAQIQSQMQMLNRCFRKQNSDTALVPLWFKSRAADCEVEFCLASKAPDGTDTNGITRHEYLSTANFNSVIKPATQWDPLKYMNVWVTQLPSGVLGYSTMPNVGPSNQDGIVVDYRYVGQSPFNPFAGPNVLGKTLVHEAGHWLGLYHIFEDSCAGTDALTCNLLGDRVCDTPPVAEPSYGSPNLLQNTCTETPMDERDMWMNYMDYVSDNNMWLFTEGQKDVMRNVLSTLRATLFVNPVPCLNDTTVTVGLEEADALNGIQILSESGFVHVVKNGTSHAVELMLYNSIGQKLAQEKVLAESARWQLPTLSSGWYYVVAQSGISKKVIKMMVP